MADSIHDQRISDYSRLLETQRRLHRVLGARLRDEAGISVVWYEALLRVARSESGHLSINELGGAMDLTSGGATRLVDRLEAEGLVARMACPSDRRVQWIALTDEGRDVLQRATTSHVRDLDELFSSRLDSEEMATFRSLLRRVMPEG